MAINDQRSPSIIISASGVATARRVLHHLAIASWITAIPSSLELDSAKFYLSVVKLLIEKADNA